MNLSLIVAHDKNRCIGNGQDIPWMGKMKDDMKHFKETTTRHTVIMGRKTYESIGKALPNRRNIVLTRDENYKDSQIQVYNNVVDLLYRLKNNLIYSDNFVIGGSEIYNAFLPYANRIYLTVIDHEFKGDKYFPELNENEWKVVSIKQGNVNEENCYPHSFIIYERIDKTIN